MTCTFPSCPRPVVARGLCDAHYKAQRRGRPLVPVRDRDAPALVTVGVRLRPETVAALGDRPSVKAREVIERWSGVVYPLPVLWRKRTHSRDRGPDRKQGVKGRK